MEILPPKSRAHHTLGLTVISIIIILLLFFLGLVVFYLWQSKYGSGEDIAKTKLEFQSQKLTPRLVPTSSGLARGKPDQGEPKAPINWTEYVTKDNPTFGSVASPVTIIAFIDFECPFSQEGYPIFKSVMETYGSAAKIVFKQLPLTSIHANALPTAEAAACAYEQDKFWEYYNYLFNTKKLSANDLTIAAKAVGLDLNTFSTCQKSAKYQKEIEKDVNDAIALGVRGTPTYFVNNEVIEGVADRALWDTIILRNLKK